MTPEKLFERYSHLVPELAAKYNLDEDQTQELWIALWEYLNTHAFYSYSEWGVHIRSALTHRAERVPSVTDARCESVDVIPLDDIAYLEPLMLADVKEILEAALRTLSARQAYVLRMRYLVGCTLEEVGDILNITRERVRQIESQALQRMHHHTRRKIFGYEAYWNEATLGTYYMEVNHGAAQDESDSDCC